jgi:4-hydroxybenzoate polyprenyltransferase
LAVILYLASLLFSLIVGFPCFIIFLAAAFAAIIYSSWPRLKRFGWLANFTIAVPRGLLVKVAGWSAVKSALDLEAWLIGSIFALFLIGAASTKDFSDIEGDQTQGCGTLPIIYGPKRALQLMHPFFIVPFLLLIPASFLTDLFSADPCLLSLVALTTAFWGHLTARQLADFSSKKLDENHPAWKQMYLMMLFFHAALAAVYLVQ